MRRAVSQQITQGTTAVAIAETMPGGMALLGLIELVLSFTVIYMVIQAPGVLNVSSAIIPAVAVTISRGPAELAAILSLTLAIVGISIGLYRPEVCQHRGRLMLGVALSTAAAFAVFFLVAGSGAHGPTVDQTMSIARIVGAWVLTIGAIRFGLGTVAYSAAPRRVLIVGDADRVQRISHRLRTRLGRQYAAVTPPATMMLSDASQHADDGDTNDSILDWTFLARQKLWGVVMASGLGSSETAALLDSKLRGLRVVSGADFQERNLGRIDLDTLTQEAMLTADGFSATTVFDRVQRVWDVAISMTMLALTLPLMLLTALAIKADTPGPVFYRQSRIGKGGTVFTVLKFRSMTTDAEAGGAPRWAQKQDPRVTRVGRFIRSTRIDELPQLLNIIRGEMSLVGPRPERPHFVEHLSKAIPFYGQRSYVKPGLTGWAQVNYPYGASVEDAREKLAYDLYYVKHRSLWLDLRILFATVRVVLTGQGAR